MPQARFLNITRKVSRDIEGPGSDMDLCNTTQIVPTPVPSTVQENEVQEVIDDPFGDDLNDLVVTPIG